MSEKEKYDPNKLHFWEALKGAILLWIFIVPATIIWGIFSGFLLYVFAAWIILAIPGYFIFKGWEIIKVKRRKQREDSSQ
ncbi:MAG: hypothetical protein KKI12_11520 [Proteobacteria bacterium]|nr:hypothetical protein [Pseudomonadota bacterium]